MYEEKLGKVPDVNYSNFYMELKSAPANAPCKHQCAVTTKYHIEMIKLSAFIYI